MTGCAASKCTIEGSGGGRVMANWEFGGVPVLTGGKWVVDEAMPTPAAPINTACYVASGMTLTLGGSAIPHNSKFTIDLGLSTNEREDLTVATFVRHFMVDGWKRRISLDPEARLVAEFDSHGGYMTAATAALVLALVSGGSTLTISAPRVQRVGISEDARSGKMTEPIEL